MRGIFAIGTVMALIGLSACGGGGTNSTPAPPQPPAPGPGQNVPPSSPPPLPPPPPPENFETAEFERSTGLGFHNALTAYRAGASGAGITVGVVDSGISDPTGDFAGRISKDSADFAGNSSYTDVIGHGTAVSAVIAAGRDDQGIMGMAWGATIMALRTDNQSDCDDDSCTHSTTSIANAIDHAREKGARVINVSLGGGASPNNLLQAVQRATHADIIIVISAGNNEAGEAPQVAPDSLAQSFADPSYSNGLVIIATSVNDNDTVSSFSAGVKGFEDVSMSALGNRVRAFDHDGDPLLYSGTSFAAPQISGAAALLAHAFPNLTSAQIVELLKSSARDVGAPGADARYGVGILDVAAAFAPVGGLRLAGSAVPLSPSTPTILSSAMGDATPTAVNAVALDDYRRAYSVDMTPDFRAPGLRHRLASSLDVAQRHVSVGTDALGASLNVRQAQDRVTTRDPLAFTQPDENLSQLKSSTLNARLSSSARAMLGLRTSLASLEQTLSRHTTPSFLRADDGFSADQTDRQPLSALALAQQVTANLRLTGGFESGEMVIAQNQRAQSDSETWREAPYRSASLSVGYEAPGIELTLGGAILDEQDSVLGARLPANFGAQSARSLIVRLGTRAKMPAGLSLTTNWQRGWTKAAAGGPLRDGGRLTSQSWSADLSRTNLFKPGDIMGLRIAQPLRVIASRFHLILPQSWDWEREIATEASVPLNLVPRGRQRDYELSYGRPIGAGWLGTNFFLREQSGNIATMPDDVGMAVRWSIGF